MMSPKVELYMHVGMWKTGTTAIQKFLHENRKVLKSFGILYPEIGIIGVAHHHFGWSFGSGREWEMRPVDFSIWSDLNNLADLDCKKIIISSETLFTVICQPNNLKKIKNTLNKFELYLVIYLRPQDEMIESGYSQLVAAGRIVPDIDEWIKQQNLNYYDILRQIFKVIPKENMVVKIYSFKKFKDKSLIEDFLNAVDEKWDNNYITSSVLMNPGLGKIAVDIAKITNILSDDNKKKEIFNHYIQKIISKNSYYFEVKRNILSNKKRKIVLDHYKKNNELLCKEFDLPIEYFHFNSKYSKSSFEPPETSIEDLSKLIYCMWEEIYKLQNESK